MEELKLTKKFGEMKLTERLRETVKMLLFRDIVLSEYDVDMANYTHAHWKREFKNSKQLEMDMKVLKQRLIETQKLLAKYNCEYEIRGYEIIDTNSEEYQQLIVPYKKVKKPNRWKLFNFSFKRKVIEG